MSVCPECDSSVSDWDDVCENCGARLESEREDPKKWGRVRTVLVYSVTGFLLLGAIVSVAERPTTRNVLSTVILLATMGVAIPRFRARLTRRHGIEFRRWTVVAVVIIGVVAAGVIADPAEHTSRTATDPDERIDEPADELLTKVNESTDWDEVTRNGTAETASGDYYGPAIITVNITVYESIADAETAYEKRAAELGDDPDAEPAVGHESVAYEEEDGSGLFDDTQVEHYRNQVLFRDSEVIVSLTTRGDTDVDYEEIARTVQQQFEE